MNDYDDRVRTYMSASQGAYADARDQAPGDRGQAAFPEIAQLLTANGHSPDKAAEIIRIAQRTWSKNLNWARALAPQREAGKASASACR